MYSSDYCCEILFHLDVMNKKLASSTKVWLPHTFPTFFNGTGIYTILQLVWKTLGRFHSKCGIQQFAKYNEFNFCVYQILHIQKSKHLYSNKSLKLRNQFIILYVVFHFHFPSATVYNEPKQIPSLSVSGAVPRAEKRQSHSILR